MVKRAVREISSLDSLQDSALLTSAEVARLTGFAEITLRIWRAKKRGPAVTWINGDLPRYKAKDVRDWLKDGGKAPPLDPDTSPEKNAVEVLSFTGPVNRMRQDTVSGQVKPRKPAGRPPVTYAVTVPPADVNFLVDLLRSAVDDLLTYRKFGATGRNNLVAAEVKISEAAARVAKLLSDGPAVS